MKEQAFPVIGMHCASCSAVITKKLKKLPGVSSCSVNTATEEAIIAYDETKVTPQNMNEQIEKLGYTLVISEQERKMDGEENIHTMSSHDHHSMGMDHSVHLGLSQSKKEKLKELKDW